MNDFEERVWKLAHEVMQDLGRTAEEIDDVVEPPGADYCLISFTDEAVAPIEVARAMGAGESQEEDEVRRALQYRFHT